MQIINVSSLARMIRPHIEAQVGKPVREGAIIVTINRREPTLYYRINLVIKGILMDLRNA